MGTHFRNVHERLKLLLTQCEVFGSDSALRALFGDSRLCEWQAALPCTHSREQRIVQTINYLHGLYDADHENGLVLLLQVLSEQTDSDDDFQLTLSDMAERVRYLIHKDNRELLNKALCGLDFEPSPVVPFVGQVIAGTGDVMITHFDTLTPGAVYRLGVVGSSMEWVNIFEGDEVTMRVFHPHEWPSEGDMIVTKYLPDGAEPEPDMDFIGTDLLGPTLKIFHRKGNGEFLLGWHKDNIAWDPAPWKRLATPGNAQKIVTRYIAPIGKVLSVKGQKQRDWNFAALINAQVLGGNR